MKTVFISDTHNQHDKITVPPADLLVHCGDFSSMGTEAELEDFGSWLAGLPHPDIFVSPGNHDGMTQEDPERARALIEKRPGIRLLIHEALDFGGIRWFFSPYTKEFGGWYWMLEEDQLRQKWTEIPADTEVLITHGPPWGILDTMERDPDAHVGCPALRKRTLLELKKLKLTAFGHIHSGYGDVSVQGIRFINAAICNDRNRVQNKPQIIDL